MTDVLLAADADWVIEEVGAALRDDETRVRYVRAGADVRGAVEAQTPDLVVLDLQIGNMGGIAACLDLRLESGVGRLPRVPVLILLDRAADLFLARQADADGWLVKPLDPFRLRLAAQKLLAGETMYEEPEPIAEVEAAEAPVDGDGDGSDDEEASSEAPEMA